jgi:hypothetical protein
MGSLLVAPTYDGVDRAAKGKNWSPGFGLQTLRREEKDCSRLVAPVDEVGTFTPHQPSDLANELERSLITQGLTAAEVLKAG